MFDHFGHEVRLVRRCLDFETWARLSKDSQEKG